MGGVLMKRFRAAIRCGLVLALSWACFPQTPDGASLFEVASVKRADTGRATGSPLGAMAVGIASLRGGPGSDDPERISYSNTNLQLVLIRAYGLERFQIFGPDWIDTDRFDIVAKVPKGATKEQFRSMLQSLLAERFQVKAHRETRTLPVFAMVVQKGGHKLRAAEGTGEPELKHIEQTMQEYVKQFNSGETLPPTHIGCKNMTMADFAGLLGVRIAYDGIDRKVVDLTGLAGAYDFDLKYYGSTPSVADLGPKIFEAVDRQLGLKLEPRKTPVEVLVVDSASRIPTEN